MYMLKFIVLLYILSNQSQNIITSLLTDTMNYYSNSNSILSIRDNRVDVTTNISYYKINRGSNYFSAPIINVRIPNVKISF